MKIVPMSVELIDSMGSDLSVVNAARVSFAKESEWEIVNYGDETLGVYATEQKLSEKDQKLINYLAKHGHWTPFGHAFLSFRIKAPIFVARQLVKHQVGLVWNEVSRRYVDEEPEFWFPEVFHARPENTIKQGASEKTVDMIKGTAGYSPLEWARDVGGHAAACYRDMLDSGVAPEEARMVLPLNSMTEWIWSGSLAAFARVCNLRLAEHGVQKATKEVAQMVEDSVPNTFQHSWKALRG